MPKEDKIKALKEIQKDCKSKFKDYKRRYIKLKKRDNLIDFCTTILNASALTFILNSPAFPPFFIPSAVCSGLQFVITRVQDKLRLKDKYNQYLTTSNQYYGVVNEILIVLHKNHLTNEQYEAFIEEITDKIGLIRDTQI